jgi:hypothetical protein
LHKYCNTALFDNLKVGDIILLKNLYFANNKGQTLTMVHRIAQIHTNPQGERIVRTKGDHTSASIPKLDYPISEVLYRQTHVCYSESGLNRIYTVLLTARLCSQPVNYIFVEVIVAGMLITIVLFIQKECRKKLSTSVK